MAKTRGSIPTTGLKGLPSAPPKRAPSEFPRGSTVNRYVILDTLGKGGMGAVFSAYDPQLDRKVALKFLRTPGSTESAETSEQQEWRERLQREAQAMARLSHPNVVTLYDVGVADNGRVFLTMEIVEGGTLGAWLKERKRSYREVVGIFCEAGQGLAAAHRAGMIHRDFKLENVLVGADGRPRVTDFGLARSVGDEAKTPRIRAHPAMPAPPISSQTMSNPLTMTGSLIGTPGYMAPEQYGAGEAIDARVDIFAFCATLYRALYGERAFPGESFEEIADATINGRVGPAPRGSDVPVWLRRVLLRGLSVDPASRPESMEELLAALRADPAKRSTRWMAAVVLAAAACVGALALHAAGQQRARACRAAGAPVREVWDARQKEGIRKAFLATGLPYAGDTWAKVERTLDAYADAWSGTSEQACLATRIRGEQSEAMLELRTACLNLRLDELRALDRVLAGANAKTVENAVQAARGLSPLETCSNVDRLGAATRLPQDSALRAEIHALEGEIADAKELDDAGRSLESLERLGSVRERVFATRYAPLMVSWRLEEANAQRDSGDSRAAVADYEEVALHADSDKLDLERAAALIRLGEMQDLFARYDDSHSRMRAAGAVLARLGGDALLEVRRDVLEAWIYVDEEKHAQALPLFERAIERARAVRLDDPPIIARAHSGLAVVLVVQGRFEEALDHADRSLRTIGDAYGPLHPRAALELNNLASIQLEAGRVDEALRSASRADALFQSAADGGEMSARSAFLGLGAQTMGEVLLRAGRDRDAAEELMRARDGYGASGEQEDTIAMVDNELAEAKRRLGHAVEADAALDEASRIERNVKGLAPTSLAATLAVRAKLALDRRKIADALPLAEEALSLQARGAPYVHEVADMRLLVARALRLNGRDPARARELAESAQEGFSKVHDQPRFDEASALLRDLRRGDSR